MTAFEDVRDAAESAAVIGKLDVATELVDRYRLGLLGSFWCDAEGIPTDWEQLSDDAQEMITARIRRQVSQSPGDLAVRAVQLTRELRRADETPPWLLQRFIESTDGVSKGALVKRLHRYDSFQVGGSLGVSKSFTDVRLFGNANIGSIDRTNLQAPGQFFFDGAGFLTKFYVTTIPPVETLYGVVTFIIGDKNVGAALAHQLLVRPQPLDVYLPARQNVSARYEVARGCGPDREHCDNAPLPPVGTRVFIHAEGYNVSRDS